MYKLFKNVVNIYTNQKIDILVNDDKIIDVSQNIDKLNNCEVINANGMFVSLPWIDSHVHCWQKQPRYKDYPDKIGIDQGVSIIIDAGSVGYLEIENFYHYAKKFKTKILSLINLSQKGITSEGELNNQQNFEQAEMQIAKAYEQYSNFIVGIKIRISASVAGNNFLQAINKANLISDKNNLPVLMHIGNKPPSIIDVLNEIDNNYIISHAFNGKENAIFKKEDSIEQVKQKIKNGILLDVGHGSESFSYKMLVKALERKITPSIISSDIYEINRKNGPVFSLAIVMSKLLGLGMDLQDVIKGVTINPSCKFKISNYPQAIAINEKAWLTFFNIQDFNHDVEDSYQNNLFLKKVIMPSMILKEGKITYVNKQKIWKMNKNIRP